MGFFITALIGMTVEVITMAVEDASMGMPIQRAKPARRSCG
jgi:energy-converting hydrogenase Eha subunit A